MFSTIHIEGGDIAFALHAAHLVIFAMTFNAIRAYGAPENSSELVALVRAQVKAWVRQSPVRHGKLLKMSFPFIGPLPPPPLLPVDAVAPKRLAVSVRRPPLSWLPLGATPPLPLPLLKADSIDRAKRRRARR